MSITTGGSFPGGSYLSGAMPTEEQLAYAAEREKKKGPRNVAEEGHEVFIGMDATLKIGWECRTCGDTATDFANGVAARDDALEHAGPKGRVGT